LLSRPVELARLAVLPPPVRLRVPAPLPGYREPQ
jgi:hypothetical protein